MKSTKRKPDPALSRFQKFEPGRVHRSELKNAPYNPRHIDAESRKRLKQVIKRVGLVESIVWNKRTGNIVGGHQRVASLDALERKKNYLLDVAVIDVDEKTEAEINVALNNPSIQGEFDVDMMAAMGKEHDIDFKDVGFTDADLDMMFDGDLGQLLEDVDPVKKAKDKLDGIKKERKDADRKFSDQHSGDFWFVVVCESSDMREKTLRMIGAPTFETYIGAHLVRGAIGDDDS